MKLFLCDNTDRILAVLCELGDDMLGPARAHGTMSYYVLDEVEDGPMAGPVLDSPAGGGGGLVVDSLEIDRELVRMPGGAALIRSELDRRAA